MATSSDGYDPVAGGVGGLDGRARLWEANAVERERLADERERVADEREALADERETLADRHDRSLDRRVADRRELGRLDEQAERAETLAALTRAEAAVERAEAELARVRSAADRLTARSDLRAAAEARADAAEHAAQTVDADEHAWLGERRDFIAAERERHASERDRLAEERDQMSGQREQTANERERGALKRDSALDEFLSSTGSAATEIRSAKDMSRTSAVVRARAGRKRDDAAAQRRTDARDHARAADSWGPVAYGPKLVATFAELATQLFVLEQWSDVSRVLKFTVDAVAGCDWASVTLWQDGRVVDAVASATIAAELDDLQFGTQLGPAPDALRDGRPIYVGRLAESRRWPVLADTAAQLGVASVLCHGLFAQPTARWSALGTFSLYSRTPDAFSEEDHDFASILAAYLSVAVAMGRRRDEIDRREAALHRGLSTRDVLGQAKGILMERQRLSAGEAFDVLRGASQRLNRKVADIALHLAETGELL